MTNRKTRKAALDTEQSAISNENPFDLNVPQDSSFLIQSKDSSSFNPNQTQNKSDDKSDKKDKNDKKLGKNKDKKSKKDKKKKDKKAAKAKKKKDGDRKKKKLEEE